MPRTDPRRSLETAARHLFRNLHDPQALRDNPLVSVYFERSPQPGADGGLEALHAVHAAVRVAIERLRSQSADRRGHYHSERRYSILLRHDLQAEPREAVARKLGLSLRQFFRERRAAVMFVAQSLVAMHDGSSPGAAVADVGGAALVRAQRLAILGGFEPALRALAEIASTAADPARRIEALCARARTSLDLGTYEDAVESIRFADGTFRDFGSGMPPSTRTRAAARIALANVSRLAHFGTDDALREQLDRALRSTTVARGGHASLDDSTYFDLLLNDTAQRAGRGDFQGAALDVARMQQVLGRTSDVRPEQEIDFAIWRAQTIGVAPDAPTELSISGVHRAAALAQRHGFTGRLTIALLTLAALTPSTPLALHYALDALAAAQQYGSPRLTAIAHLHVATWKNHNAAGHVEEHVRIALRDCPAGSRTWSETAITASRIALEAGDVAAALDLATRAERVAANLHNPRLRGVALRELALAQLAARRPRIAAATIRDALAMLEVHGSRHALSLAHRAASRISSRRSLARVC